MTSKGRTRRSAIRTKDSPPGRRCHGTWHACSLATRRPLMKLGMQIGYSGAGVSDSVDAAKLADELGFHSIWTAEAYGSDAISPLVWMGAHTQNVKLATGIMQMPARTPAMT